MKEALVAFFVAFGLTIGCSALKLIGGTSAISFFLLTFTSPLTIIISLVVIGIFFGIFYLLAETKNLVAKKSVVLAILLGIIIGGIASVLLLWISPQAFQASIFMSFITSSFILYFFPSVTALLLIELRNKKQESTTQPTL